MKDIKGSEIASERELTSCGGVTAVLVKVYSYFLFYIFNKYTGLLL